jgi:hypothetical protein
MTYRHRKTKQMEAFKLLQAKIKNKRKVFNPYRREKQTNKQTEVFKPITPRPNGTEKIRISELPLSIYKRFLDADQNIDLHL